MLFYGGGLVALALFLLWVFCIFDVISTDEVLTRNMPKFVWLLVVIFVPTVGSIAWLALGRPANASLTPGGAKPYRPPPRPLKAAPKGPEDSPEFMSGLDERARELKRWEDDLKRREEDLRKREDDA
ncbi:MAG TPA: PLD nuclease N-terminal domain-containing protein [Actinomycetota bacterium]|nr:PLD nuclease N-terminal domain-containing protein [Actinomycetota bacterium]